jgi:hypothetical protein
MDVFLDAECVFSALAGRGIIIAREWKSRHPETTRFTAHFSLKNSHGLVSFEVHKRDGRYFITTKSLEIISYVHKLDVDDLYSTCLL